MDFFLFLQELAAENKAHRDSITDTHTLGPNSMAQVRDKLVCDSLLVFPPFFVANNSLLDVLC